MLKRLIFTPFPAQERCLKLVSTQYSLVRFYHISQNIVNQKEIYVRTFIYYFCSQNTKKKGFHLLLL